MKKIFLSALVIFAFSFYALKGKIGNENNENIAVTPPINLLSPSPQATNYPTPIAQSQQPSPTSITPSPTPKPKGLYKDGQYTGDVTDAYYGNVQVQAIITGGKIIDVKFLDYPQDRRTSVQINSQAMPYLTQEAIQTQSAQVDIISGATATSEAFIQSLQSALVKARS